MPIKQWLSQWSKRPTQSPEPQDLKRSGLVEQVALKDGESPTQIGANPLFREFLSRSTGDLHKWHHYFDVYDLLFSRLRETQELRILEIGVKKGGSLRLWRDYFHPTSSIIGADIDPVTSKYEDSQANIYVRIGDQANPSFLRRLVSEFGSFDIVIDDGGHTTNQQITSFLHLYPSVKDNGIYIVEDTHSNYWPTFQDRKDNITFINLAKALVDRLHEPYFGVTQGFPYRLDNPERLREITVSRFCAQTRSISFYDSIVVFHKARKSFPRNELR